MKINSITIQNFRCLNEIKLQEITPITVLVGRNNTGKSALLEAISLVVSGGASWFDSLGTDLLQLLTEKRGGWDYANMMIKMGKPYANIAITGENIKMKLQITRTINDLPENFRSLAFATIDSYLERIFTTFDTRINTYLQERSEQIKESFEQQRESLNEILNESFNWLKDNLWKEFKSYVGFYDLLNDTAKIAFIGKTERLTKFFKSLSKNLRNFFRKMDFHIKPFFYYIQIEDLIRSSEMKSDMLFNNTLFLLNPTIEYLKKLYQNLTKNGKLLEIINIIKERITYFEDIREINNHFLVFLKELEKPIPLESMGDGFIAQLTLLFAIANLKKGVILMEEPENNLHPGYMSLVANQIIQTAVQGDFQYFISTHSLEFLQFLLEANSELVKIVRMYRCDDKPMIDYEVLSGSEALEEFKELQMDLRGI